jgi:hypothetical protein
MPTANKFVKHAAVAPDAGLAFVGNTFWHGALLRPIGTCSTTVATACDSSLQCPGTETCNASSAGRLATARLQKDAITYLFLNQ